MWILSKRGKFSLSLSIYIWMYIYVSMWKYSKFLSLTVIFLQENSEKNKPDEVMESNIDAMEWKLEVERVMHQLKVTVRNDSRVMVLSILKIDCIISILSIWMLFSLWLNNVCATFQILFNSQENFNLQWYYEFNISII